MPHTHTPTAILEAKGAFEKNPNRKRDAEPVADGEPIKPKHLKGAASRIWDEYCPRLVKMGTAYEVDSAALAAWCCLQAEFQKDPARMNSSRIAQMRAYEDRFGMNASARAKLGSSPANKPTDPAEKYFGDNPGSSSRIFQ